MARQAERDGIEIVVATPHIRADHDVRVGELEGRVTAVNAELERHGVGVRVALGGELAEAGVEEATDEDLREVSLASNGRWLLLEPRPGPLGEEILTTVRRLNDRGFRSIVAHPERHAGAAFRARLEALVAEGALIQVTAALI